MSLSLQRPSEQVQQEHRRRREAIAKFQRIFPDGMDTASMERRWASEEASSVALCAVLADADGLQRSTSFLRLVGFEDVVRLVAGSPVLFTTVHLGCYLPLVPLLSTLGRSMVVASAVRNVANASGRQLWAPRYRFVYTDANLILECLRGARKGENLWAPIDIRLGVAPRLGRDALADFLGHRIRLPLCWGLIATRARIPCVFCYMRRISDGGLVGRHQFEAVFEVIWEPHQGGSGAEISKALIRSAERVIRLYPEQYGWTGLATDLAGCPGIT